MWVQYMNSNCESQTVVSLMYLETATNWGVPVLLKFIEGQILWSLSLVDFHNFTLQLPIQTLHSVAPELQVFVSSHKKRPNFRKTSTPQV